MINAKLAVYIDSDLVGHLWLNDKKLFCFEYTKEWVSVSNIPLSLALPLMDVPYLNDESHPFFANLLPEGHIREVLARRLGLSAENDFSILEKIGGDCAGAVSVLPNGEVPENSGSGYVEKSNQEMKQIINELPMRPFLAGEEGIRLSLAGAQKKLPVAFKDRCYFIAMGNAPSTHIIKPPIGELDGSVENEAFCMDLAGRVGLLVPTSFLNQIDDLRFFVVERYDRSISEEGVKRLHQEDFCQALGILPNYKYEIEGGPSFLQCSDIIRKNSIQAAKDLSYLVKWSIFNYLIGNTDSHGKNISLIFLPNGPILAPFYDLLSTTVYSHFGVNTKLAMKIGGEDNRDALRRVHWEAFAEEIEIKPSYLFGEMLRMSKEIKIVSTSLFVEHYKKLKVDSLFRLVQEIHENADSVMKRFC